MLQGRAPDAQVLKKARRRLVARVASEPSVIVKAFPLDLLARLRYSKYALRELEGYAQARARDIPTPSPLAYFERRHLGLVAVTGLAIEDLRGWTTLREVSQRDATFVFGQPVLNLFANLFLTGANHIDPNPDNIMVAPNLDSVCLIDWQYASFPPPRRTEQLVLQIARFMAYSDIDPYGAIGRVWLDDLCSICRPDIATDKLRDMVAKVARIKQPYRKRLALKITGLD